MTQQTSNHLWHDLLAHWLCLGIEVEFSEVETAYGSNVYTSSSSTQHSTQVHQTNIRHLGRVGDVKDGEALTGVGHHMQHVVGGDMLQIERVETTALCQA